MPLLCTTYCQGNHLVIIRRKHNAVLPSIYAIGVHKYNVSGAFLFRNIRIAGRGDVFVAIDKLDGILQVQQLKDGG